MKCTNPACETELAAEAQFCSACGTRATPLGVTPPPETFSGARTHLAGAAAAGAPVVLEEGRVFGGRYEIVRQIGRGGMGDVYLAKDRNAQGDAVCLKLLRPELMATPALIERFREEGRRSRQLRHPKIVATFDLDQREGIWFFSMEYVEGRSLREWFVARHRGGRGVSIEEALWIAREVLSALDHAHALMIHRDIKPENIMLVGEPRQEGAVAKLLDFGIARALDGSPAHLTRGPLGTRGYMAPEQLSGAEVDHRADLFAVGVVLYELVCGVAYDGNWEAPSEVVAECPAWLDLALKSLLSKFPAKRPQSAAAALEALDGAGRSARPGPGAAAKVSVDVGCGSCGHRNQDEAAEVCERCAGVLTEAFGACPGCLARVRKDLAACPRCQNAVAAWFWGEEQLERADALAEEDPARTISVLEGIIREAEGLFGAQARQKLKGLRPRFEQAQALAAQAVAARESTDLAAAEKHWKAVLELFPRHAIALASRKETSALRSSYSNLIWSASRAGRDGDLAESRRLLEEARELLPGAAQVDEELAALDAREREHAEHLEAAAAAWEAGRADEAMAAATQALKRMPRSEAAQEIGDKARRYRSLHDEVKQAILAADFDRARVAAHELGLAAPSRQTEPPVTELLASIEDLAAANASAVAEIEKRIAEGELEAASERVERLREAHPHSVAATEIAERVDAIQDGCRSELSEAFEADLRRAEFDAAGRRLDAIEARWSGAPLAEADQRLRDLEARHAGALLVAEEAAERGDNVEAREHLRAILESCPDSVEATRRLEEVEARMRRARAETEEREAAEARRKAAARRAGIVTLVLVALAIAAVIAWALWQWVTGTMWPWCLENNDKLFWTSVGISLVAGATHAGKFESAKDTFWSGCGASLGGFICLGGAAFAITRWLMDYETIEARTLLLILGIPGALGGLLLVAAADKPLD